MVPLDRVSMDEWYYQRAGATFGPISAGQLLALRERGTLTDETRLRRGFTGEWIEFKDVALAGAAATPPVLPPPIPAIPRPASSSRPRSGRLVPGGPSMWLWFFGVLAVILLTAHSLILTMNALSFALVMLPTVELPEPMIVLVNFCAEALIFSSVLYFVSVISWQGAAFASLARVYGENNLPHGSGSGFWWVTPFANFVMPFRCLRVMRHLSRRLRDAAETKPGGSLLVLGIQLTFIASTVFRVIEKVAAPFGGHSEMEPGSDSPFLAMMWDLSLAAFALQLAIFILINLIQQVRLFHEATPVDEPRPDAP